MSTVSESTERKGRMFSRAEGRGLAMGTEYLEKDIVLELGNGMIWTTCNGCEHTEPLNH